MSDPDKFFVGPTYRLRDVAALGLQIDGVRNRVSLVRPALPPFLNDIEITNLRIGASLVDLHVTRHGEDVSTKVLRRQGELEILISQ